MRKRTHRQSEQPSDGAVAVEVRGTELYG
jgi:hypothetical protein